MADQRNAAPTYDAWLWKWVRERFSTFSYNVQLLIADVMVDPGRTGWHVSDHDRSGVTLARIVDRESGAWPYDQEQVRIAVDAIGRFKNCTRSKVIIVETGRGHADARRMLRLGATS